MFSKYLTLKTDQNSKKLKLKVVFTTILVVPFVAQILVAVGLTGWLSLRSGQRAVNQVATQLRREITHRIQDQLDNYLETPHQLNQMNADAARLGQVDLNDLRGLELRFWRQIQLYNSLSSIGFGTKNGTYVAGDRRGNSFRLGRKDGSSPNDALHMYETDSQGNPLRLIYTGKPNYDPRTRAWYKLGTTAPQGRWTDIFTYSAQPIYVISAVRAVYDQSNQFQGVILTDLMLSDIGEFLRSLKVGTSGQTFILERSGELVATSTSDRPFELINGQAQRLKATESNSPLIRATAQYLTQKFGDLSKINHSQQLDFKLNGKREFLQVLPYSDRWGLDWLIVVVIPEADFMTQIDANVHSTILLCLIALGIAITVGLITAQWLVRPIVRLAAAATVLADGDWDKTVPIEREDELGVLAAAFNRMAGQLRESLIALEQREAKLAEAQKVAQVGSWEFDLTTRTVTWSDELFRICGLEPQPAAPNRPESLQLIHPDDVEGVLQAVERGIQQAEPFEIDYRLVRRDGQIRCVHAKGQPTLDASGQVIRLFGTVLDITERQQAEWERDRLLKRERAAREEAEAANRIKDEFLAVLSHELRTPLNSILGWAKLLRTRSFDAAKTAKALEIIERNAQLQTQLIEDLLDVSRILRGKLTLQMRPVELPTVITAAIETVRLAAEAKSIQLETIFEPTAFRVNGDPNRLQQVVWNLLSNAVKFTPSGGQVEIKLKRRGTQAQIAVSDTGKGIDSNFLPHIFEYFRQEDSTTTRNFGGLGLGLAIAHQLVELHGGTISAASQGIGLGATFTVVLPLMAASQEASAGEGGLGEAPNLQGVRILAVDDERDNLEFLVCLLEEFGAVVTAVASGEEALAAIATEPPDVLLSDIGMPGMDGYALIERVRGLLSRSGKPLVVLALTAYAGETNQQKILNAGFQAHITKPIEPTQLVSAIANLLRQKPEQPTS